MSSNLFKDKDKKRLFENFISLSVLQGANYILPLITLPYLVRVLGPEKFGLIAFAQAFVQYFNILTDYGFNLSATREIAIHREDKEKVSEIFSAVMIIKFGLLILSFIILTIIVFSFKKFRQDWLIYYLTFGMVVGQALFPIWFFQGMERMKYITFLNITAKLIFTVSIFIFVHEVSDYVYVPLINSLGFLISGILAIWLIFKNFKIKFKVVNISNIKYQLKIGWHIFISMIGIQIYKTTNTVVLGIFTNNKIVGYFSIANKLINAANNFNVVISQTVYPYVMKYIKRKNINHFFKKIFGFIFIFNLLIGLLFFFFSDQIIEIVAGENYEIAIISLKILAFTSLIIGINIPGVHFLLGNKADKIFANILISGGILNILLNILLVPFFSYIGSCSAILITEVYITSMIYIACFKISRMTL